MGRKRKEITFYVDNNGCWICTSHSKSVDGYPLTKRNGKTINLHRFLYEEWIGVELPSQRVIRHTCDNPACINLHHLEEGTIADNNRDMVKRGRNAHLKGEGNPQSRLHEADVKFIKRSILNGCQLAKIFGVCKKTIYMIKKGVTWKHV